MPQYLVKEPCMYVTADGLVSHHRDPGAVIDVPEDVAAKLGDAVQPLVTGAVPDVAAPEQFPAVTAAPDEARPRRGRSPSAIHEVTAGEGDSDG
jgi:hypothetical protein